MFRTVGKPKRAYLILSLERTGSGLLCDALRRTGRLGTPSELFGADALHPATPFPDYVDRIARQTTSGGVFGAKVHRNQYRELERAGNVTSPLDLVPTHCRRDARMVLLRREDRERQAISILLARGTGVWALADGDDTPVTLPADPHWLSRLHETPDDLSATLDEITATILDEARAWQDWLELANPDALHITYENLVDDYAATVVRVARHVAGVTLNPEDVPPARSRKQGDERTESMLRSWVR